MPRAIPQQENLRGSQLFPLSEISELGKAGAQEDTLPWERDQLLITSEGEIGVMPKSERRRNAPPPLKLVTETSEGARTWTAS